MLLRVTARAYRLAVMITVTSFGLSSCKRSSDSYVMSMCSKSPWSSVLHALWGYAWCFVSLLEATALQ